MMNVSSDYIYDDAILNRPCLSERNGKIGNGEKRPTPLGSRTDCSATDGRSDMRLTPFDREEIGLAYSMSFIAKHESRAKL